jgi:hypothetical protein
VTADEPARGVNLQKALEQTVSDGPRTHWFFACGRCTRTFTCADCERGIDATEYDALYPLEDPYLHELWYGNPDNFDPDR